MQNKFKHIATALIFLALIGTASAAEYYIDPVSGNDAYPGSQTQPWKTLAYALNSSSPVAPGDTVFLRGGTYREQVYVTKSGAENNWITVKSYAGEKAVLDGTDIITDWTQAQSNDSFLTVLEVVNPQYSNIYWVRMKASDFPADLSNVLLFENREMERVASDPDQSVGFGHDPAEFRKVGQASNGQIAYLIDPALAQSDDYWNGTLIHVFLYGYNANTVSAVVTDYVSSEQKIVFDSPLPAAITWLPDPDYHKDSYRFVNHPHILDSPGEFYISGIENVDGTDYRRIYYWPKNVANLESNMTSPSKSNGIWSVGKNDFYLILDDLTIFGYKESGIVFSTQAANNQRGTNVIVRNSTITDCGDYGIDFVYMNSVRAENNFVRRCNNRGIMCNGADDCVFKGNDVGDTGTTNISFYNSTNSMMINNTLRGIRGSHGNGTSIYTVGGPFCENILVAGNQYYNTNMAFNDVKNLVVFGNLFRGDSTNPSQTMTPWSSSYDGYQVWINNTSPVAPTWSLALQDKGILPDPPHQYVINNILHGLIKDWDTDWNAFDPSKIIIEDRSYNAYNYYEWQQNGDGWSLNEGEQDLRSKTLTDLFVNPIYPNGDYHLKADSPLISTGKNVQEILTNLGIIAKFPEYDFTKDLAGNPWNDIPSIGAYEYQGALLQCQGTDTSCGTYPDCQNCNSQDGCVETAYRNYSCEGTSCSYAEQADDPRCQAVECVDLTALTNHIAEWKQGSLGMLSLIQNIEAWKAGTGC